MLLRNRTINILLVNMLSEYIVTLYNIDIIFIYLDSHSIYHIIIII